MPVCTGLFARCCSFQLCLMKVRSRGAVYRLSTSGETGSYCFSSHQRTAPIARRIWLIRNLQCRTPDSLSRPVSQSIFYSWYAPIRMLLMLCVTLKAEYVSLSFTATTVRVPRREGTHVLTSGIFWVLSTAGTTPAVFKNQQMKWHPLVIEHTHTAIFFIEICRWRPPIVGTLLKPLENTPWIWALC